MRSRNVVALVIGCLLALPGLSALIGGGVLAAANAWATDDEGWFSTSVGTVQTSTVGVSVEDVIIETDLRDPSWLLDRMDLGVRVRATPRDPAKPVFIGIGPADQVNGYLAGTAHDRLVRFIGARPQYSRVAGDSEIAPPTEQQFWVAQDSGTGLRELTWSVSTGRWAVVMMNADGSAGVDMGVSVAARGDFVVPLIFLLLGIGLVLTGLAAALIAYAVSRPRAGPAPPMGAATGAPSGAAVAGPVAMGAAGLGQVAPVTMSPGTPVVITARLDPQLSRGLWIIKWFLAIPHFVVLAFLWAAFVITTIVAGFAILFTGRYPRSLFDFNVGVLRWGWRVSYYCAGGGLGTDRYPPFTLDQLPDDPATLDVAYPEQLSRGLWLVKWILAFPHWIVVGLLVGGGWGWTSAYDNDWDFDPLGSGILGLLALVVGLVLLFTGAYPRGLFDVIIGLNRWVYRVIAYVALMTDDYPPFRLDTGPTEGSSELVAAQAPHPQQPPPPPPPALATEPPHGAPVADLPPPDEHPTVPNDRFPEPDDRRQEPPVGPMP